MAARGTAWQAPILVALLLLAGCQAPRPARESPSATHEAPSTVPVTFQLPSTAPAGIAVRFPVLWGPMRMDAVPMVLRGDHYEATVDLPEGGLIPYGYQVEGLGYDRREQWAPDAEPQRMLLVQPGLVVEDEPYAFGPEDPPRPVRIEGRVTDAASGQPILDAVIVADGIAVLVTDGHYWVDVRDRPVWVTVFTFDGSHRARSDLVTATRHDVTLSPAAPATVILRPTADLPAHHRLRVVGTAEQMGANFLLRDRFTWETYQEMDSELVLPLHDGQWVDYLYTAANIAHTFEHDQGQAKIRSFVARDGLVLEDRVGPLVDDDVRILTVRVPDYTDPTEPIGVAGFDPRLHYMHPVGDGTWTLALSNGGFATGSTYRYHRTWSGPGDEPTTSRTLGETDRVDVIDHWRFQHGPVPPYQVDVPAIRNPFRIWAEFPDWWSSHHALLLPGMVDRAAAAGFHGVMPAQVWGFAELEPAPRMAPNAPLTLYAPPGEIERAARLAHEKGLEVVVRPQAGFDPEQMTNDGKFDAAWWRAWLVEIERFNLHQARSAEAAGVDVLTLTPRHPFWSVPASFLAEYDAGMEGILAKMRQGYSGKIIAIFDQYIGDLAQVDHWRQADYIYQTAHQLDATGDSQAEIDAAVAKMLDDDLKWQADHAGRPMVVSLGYASVDGASRGVSVPEHDGPHTPQHEGYPLDVEEQRRIYEAFFRAANDRPWIAGFQMFVVGPAPEPETRAVGITGKPAEAVASAWAKAIDSVVD